ncbi:MAG: VWA domain-containing protein [Methyloceanibacter sp.]
MSNGFAVSGITARHIVRLTAIASAVLLACNSASRTEEKTIPPCHEDAMIVFDASGSMSGNETLGIPNSRARIDEARSALAQVLPNATKFRRVGLVTYGPGPYNQCNVKLEFKPTPDAAGPIMSTVNAIVPAGKTPLTSGIEAAAEALDFRTKPGVVVVITDGEETCGRSPCDLAKQLRAAGYKLTIHVVAFRYDSFSWTGGEQRHGPDVRGRSEWRPLCQGQQRARACGGAGEDAGLPDDLPSAALIHCNVVECRIREASICFGSCGRQAAGHGRDRQLLYSP